MADMKGRKGFEEIGLWKFDGRFYMFVVAKVVVAKSCSEKILYNQQNINYTLTLPCISVPL